LSIEARKDRVQPLRAQVLADDLREYRAEVSRQREIATLVELLGLEPRPSAEHALPVHVAADHEERRRVAVVRPAIAVLTRGATELRHREYHDVRHAIAEIAHERRDRLGEVVQSCRE